MKLRSLVILSVLLFGATGTLAHMDKEGMMEHHHMMVDKLFGDKTELTKEEFMKHFEDKFDEIDTGKTGKISKEEASKDFEAKMKKHMDEHMDEHMKKMNEEKEATK